MLSARFGSYVKKAVRQPKGVIPWGSLTDKQKENFVINVVVSGMSQHPSEMSEETGNLWEVILGIIGRHYNSKWDALCTEMSGCEAFYNDYIKDPFNLGDLQQYIGKP